MSNLRIGLTMLAWRAGLRAQAALGDPLSKILSRGPNADPYGRYELVRANGELTKSKLGVYVTASHQLSNTILRDSRFGVRSSEGLSRNEWQKSDASETTQARMINPIDDSFLSLDPPQHTRLRRLVAPWFTPRALRDAPSGSRRSPRRSSTSWLTANSSTSSRTSRYACRSR